MTFLKLATRNIGRNKKRTMLIVSAVAFSVFISVFVMALSDGSHEAMITNTLRTFTGYGQIQLAPDPKVKMSDVIDWNRLCENLGRSDLVKFDDKTKKIISNFNIVPDFTVRKKLLKTVNDWLLSDSSLTAKKRNTLEKLLSSDIIVPIADKTFSKNPVIENTFPYDDKLKDELKNCSSISGWSPRLMTYSMVATESNSTGGLVLGIVPSQEAAVTNLSSKIFKGSYLEDEDSKVCVIGYKLAKLLKTEIGKKVVLITRGVDGSTGALKLTIKGLIKSGTDQFDKMLIMIPIKDCEYLLRCDGQIHYIACAATTADGVEDISQNLKTPLASNGLVFLTWQELIPDLLEFLALDSFFGYIFLGIILTVVVFGVLTGIITSILERTGEFGIMIAIGTKPFQVVRLILYESIIITGSGALAGLATGLPLSWWLTYNPIELPLSNAEVMATYGMENLLCFIILPHKMAAIVAFLFFVSIGMCLIPAIRASHLKPVHAIREARR